eukprot:SM000035S13083  [mRNA]  locus=s35:319882:321862:+ [translate_table: standard]
MDAQAPSKADEPLPELMTEFMVDIKCEGCVKSVRTKLELLEGVQHVDVDLPNQVVRVLGTSTLTSLTSALEQSGRKSRLIGQGSPAELALSSAVAEFKGPRVFGVVRFAQVSQEQVRLEATIDGLFPGSHSWSINEYGDLTKGAASTGGLYKGVNGCEVGLLLEERLGDLGSLVVDTKGHTETSSAKGMLKVWDLIGRAVVIQDGSHNEDAVAAVIARSAGVGQNYKQLCTCDGTIIWESTPSDYFQA